MAQVLVMRFKNALGNTVSISLADPKAGLTQAQVITAMDEVIVKNVFDTTGGDLVSKLSATVVDTTETKLYSAG